MQLKQQLIVDVGCPVYYERQNKNGVRYTINGAGSIYKNYSNDEWCLYTLNHLSAHDTNSGVLMCEKNRIRKWRFRHSPDSEGRMCNGEIFKDLELIARVEKFERASPNWLICREVPENEWLYVFLSHSFELISTHTVLRWPRETGSSRFPDCQMQHIFQWTFRTAETGLNLRGQKFELTRGKSVTNRKLKNSQQFKFNPT